MVEVLDSLWIEKYRPQKLEELVLPEQYYVDFKSMIDKGSIPNLLFYGPPGGGKSTIAKVICSKSGVLFNKRDNLLYVNGSSKSSRGIGYVDTVIEPFLKHPPSRDKYKIVFIDEADNLTEDSYNSLRAIIEKYHVEYGRFIFTCNYVSQIPDPIQSRFMSYLFSQIPKEFILDYCKRILDSETIKYFDDDIKVAINNLYPDVRKIVNALQRASWSGNLKINEKDVITNEKKIISFIIEGISLIEKGLDKKIGGVINSIVELISSVELEYKSIYVDLFFNTSIPVPARIVINKYANEHKSCLVANMHFMAMVFDVVKSLQAYRNAVNGR